MLKERRNTVRLSPIRNIRVQVANLNPQEDEAPCGFERLRGV